jgi:glutathione synthase/RimK-type ligase-like ATP-grasp enzyme
MILLCGIPSEPSLGLVIDALERRGAPHIVFNQRDFAEAELEFEVAASGVTGRLDLDGLKVPLADVAAVYTRVMDFRLLPELEDEAEDSPRRQHCQSLHAALMQWYELSPALVLNRSHEVGLNYSKPLQAQLISRNGFAVADTVVTNDPDLVREFRRRHKRVVYKSVSCVRSIVKMLEDEDENRLGAIRACPTQFQEFLDGINVRVHTVNGRAFATAIRSRAVDYRYAYEEGEQETLEPYPLSAALTERCLALAAAFDLEFAGIDLKVTPGDDVYCLEVNPCPAFSYYELHTGQPIAAAVADYLASVGRG